MQVMFFPWRELIYHVGRFIIIMSDIPEVENMNIDILRIHYALS